MESKKIRLDFNSPVLLSFIILSAFSLALNTLTNGWSNEMIFSIYSSPWANPMSFIRLFTHVLGHADWAHFSGNIMLLLLVGPLLEEKYGSGDIFLMIVVTAFVTGLASVILFPSVRLLGASGVVFAMILASSFVSFKEKTIPITFLLVAFIYVGQEIYSAVFINDSVSQLAHILGGTVGASFAYGIHRVKRQY